MNKKILVSTGAVILIAALAFYLIESNKDSSDAAEIPSVLVTEGTIIDKALATGTIQPENEIQVKSKISGVVSQLYVTPGAYVSKGDALLEIRPDPTPLEMAEAKRNLELTEITLSNLAAELERSKKLMERGLISAHDHEGVARRYDDALVRHQMNQERLQLLESGRIRIGDSIIESVIRAPIDGYILERMVEIGDPIVPLTSYQAGTPLMTIANMENLIFKGTVDEIDVGKIHEGMEAEIKIGALPDVPVSGVLRLISLKSQKQDNTTVFPIEILITNSNGTTLRAGYSANADIIIQRRQEVLIIPERVVTYRDGQSFIEVPGDEPGSRVEKEIKTGLSDAIHVEVKDGVKEGDKVLEKPVRRISATL